MFVASSLRGALRTTLGCTLPRLTSTFASLAPDIKRPLDDPLVRVQIGDKDDGEEFVCDEEPLVLTPQQGFGYCPVALGQHFGEGKLEIVRKIGWASNSNVWLARTLG